MVSQQSDWYGPDAATFGDRLAGAREHAGMSRAQLARRLGVTKGTLASWEEDRSEPRANRLSMLAGLLNVSISWLLTGEGSGMAASTGDSAKDLAPLLSELRAIRADLASSSERAERLERTMRRLLERESA